MRLVALTAGLPCRALIRDKTREAARAGWGSPVSSPVTWFSYNELAEALGIERESARRLVIRKRWKRFKGNDGRARVEVPNDELPARITPPVTGEHPV